MSIAITTACWGNYWERFGIQFAESIAKMNRQPDETIVVGEIEIAPIWIDVQRPESLVFQWDWFNEAVKHSTAEWVVCLGVDDEMLPTGFDDLHLEGYVIAITGLENGSMWGPVEHEYPEMLWIDHNPMRGGTIFRREVFLRYPWRPVVWPDWAQWLEFNDAGVDVRFDYTPRFTHHRHSRANSMTPSAVGDQQIRDLKEQLLTNSMIITINS